jgi:hypothetical protein
MVANWSCLIALLHILHMTLGHVVISAGAAAVAALPQQARQQLFLRPQQLLLHLQQLVQQQQALAEGRPARRPRRQQQQNLRVKEYTLQA